MLGCPEARRHASEETSRMAGERWEKLDVWKMAEVKYLVYFAHRLGYLKDAEYTDLKNGYERLGKSLWRFYETVQQ